MREGRACNRAEGKTVKGELPMDNNKKQKIVAIIVSTLISLAVSIVACLLGVSPDAIAPCQADTDTFQSCATVYSIDD